MQNFLKLAPPGSLTPGGFPTDPNEYIYSVESAYFSYTLEESNLFYENLTGELEDSVFLIPVDSLEKAEEIVTGILAGTFDYSEFIF